MGTTAFPMKKSPSADALLAKIYCLFQAVPDSRSFSKPTQLGLKFPSLLQYDQGREVLDDNLKSLYHVSRFVSDSYLRERLDELNPDFIRPAFKSIFADLQREKCLKSFEFLEGHYLLSVDGTGHFSSGKVSCPQCCTKEHRKMLGAWYRPLRLKCGSRDYI